MHRHVCTYTVLSVLYVQYSAVVQKGLAEHDCIPIITETLIMTHDQQEDAEVLPNQKIHRPYIVKKAEPKSTGGVGQRGPSAHDAHDAHQPLCWYICLPIPHSPARFPSILTVLLVSYRTSQSIEWQCRTDVGSLTVVSEDPTKFIAFGTGPTKRAER